MENKNYIRFKENFDGKLDKDVFTTIRPDDPMRYQVGELYDIYLGEDKLFKALMTKMSIINRLEDLPINIIQGDTGLTTVEEFIELLKSIYGDIYSMNWILVTLKKI